MSFITILSWSLLVLTLGAGVAVYTRAKSQGARTMPALSGAYDLFISSLMLILSAIHLIAILVEPFTGKGMHAESFTYNFRFYSLILIGAVQVLPAYLCLRSAKGLIWQEPEMWKRAFRWSIVLTAVNIPLAPIQGFAVAFAIFAFVNLILLVAGRKYFRQEPAV